MSAPISFTVTELNDTTDKLNLNLAHICGQLTAIRSVIGTPVTSEEETALSLAYAADHFLGLLKSDLSAFEDLLAQKKEA